MMRARNNPFSTDRVLRERYRLDEAGWADLFTRLGKLNHRAVIVGPHGSGKTTLLEDLAGRLRADGWQTHLLRLHSDRRSLSPQVNAAFFAKLTAKDFILLDGAEQLRPWSWWYFRQRTRSAGGLVVTTHRPGRLPILKTCATSPALLQTLAHSLGKELSSGQAEDLHDRHHGNLREALRELYDWHAGKTLQRTA